MAGDMAAVIPGGQGYGPGPISEPQVDFFFSGIFDATPKDDMATMEHPAVSLSIRPDQRMLRYDHRGTMIKVTPSVRGLATIHDKEHRDFIHQPVDDGTEGGPGGGDHGG